MKTRNGKSVFEVKIGYDQETFNKINNFLKKRNLLRTRFVKVAIINQIKKVLEIERDIKKDLNDIKKDLKKYG